jgi:hypothetical protein
MEARVQARAEARAMRQAQIAERQANASKQTVSK